MSGICINMRSKDKITFEPLKKSYFKIDRKVFLNKELELMLVEVRLNNIRIFGNFGGSN